MKATLTVTEVGNIRDRGEFSGENATGQLRNYIRKKKQRIRARNLAEWRQIGREDNK